MFQYSFILDYTVTEYDILTELSPDTKSNLFTNPVSKEDKDQLNNNMKDNSS